MNRTPKTIRALQNAGRTAYFGALEAAPTVTLKANDAASIGPDYFDFAGRPADPTAVPPITAIAGKQPLYQQARIDATLAQSALKEAIKSGRAFVAKAVDILKGNLGRRWTDKWVELGFPSGSLALPIDPRSVLINLEIYFRTHPDQESASLNLTAVKAQQALRAIDNAFRSANAAVVREKAAKQERDAAAERLRLRLSGLRQELGKVLSNDSSNWYHFGFRRPIDGNTPDVVETINFRVVAPGEVEVEWSHARLADNYRVSWIVSGSSGVPATLGLINGQRTLISGLPHPANITVIITARNSAGESVPAKATIALA